MEFITIIGVVASIFTGISLLPQLVKIVKEKKAEAISLGTYGVLIIGLICWVVYGIFKKDWIIVISNSFSVAVNAAIIFCSLRYKKKAS